MDNEKKLMKIGELAKLTNVTIDTLRYYDKIGLLVPCGRRESKYRLYDMSAVDKLSKIKFYQQLGYKLEEIKEHLDSNDMAECADEKIQSIDAEIRRLENRKRINELFSLYGDSLLDIDILKGGELTPDEFFELTEKADEKYKDLDQKLGDKYTELLDQMLGRVSEVAKNHTSFRDFYSSYDEVYSKVDDAVEDFYESLCELLGDDPDDVKSCSFSIFFWLYLGYSGNGVIAQGCDKRYGKLTTLWVAEAMFLSIDVMTDDILPESEQ